MAQPIVQIREDAVASRLHVLPQSRQLRALHSIVRSRNATRGDFVHHSNRIIRQLLDAAIDLLPHEAASVETPVGATYEGLRLTHRLTGVSVIRAGESMEGELRALYPAIGIGKILIQRDKTTKLPKLFYHNLPADIAEGHVLLLDPMLATGGTALEAINVLAEQGVPESRIILVTFIAAPEGVARVNDVRPEVTIVTSSLEQRLNENAYMIPGIGDFGDRYFGTDLKP
ncbi:MAG TPA: uracil phosphoribosyltransferase [Sphingobium sp.]|uniref:uracil phosphoribosyltransferase n=1 Tax=Sphingobium sp. TaxID=1912891 RepID=UPI002ED0BA49